MGGEGHPRLGDLPQPGQGKHLKAAAVGEHRAVPLHKAVQPPHLPDHPVPGAQVQMVGVGQLHLTADLLQIVGGHRPLDGPLGAHVHKDRGLDSAVGTGKYAPAGVPLGLDHFKHKKTPLTRSVRSLRILIIWNQEINMASPMLTRSVIFGFSA